MKFCQLLFTGTARTFMGIYICSINDSGILSALTKTVCLATITLVKDSSCN